MTKKPNPGSDEAVDQGCSCPVLDNGRGNEELGKTRGFWIDGDCPLHADNFEKTLEATMELYELSDDCPPELAGAIGMLRQLVNESSGPVSSQFIWDVLKEEVEASNHQAVEDFAAGLKEAKWSMPRGREVIDVRELDAHLASYKAKGDK